MLEEELLHNCIPAQALLYQSTVFWNRTWYSHVWPHTKLLATVLTYLPTHSSIWFGEGVGEEGEEKGKRGSVTTIKIALRASVWNLRIKDACNWGKYHFVLVS